MNLTLASIHIYPIKSLGGFAVHEARLTDRGLEHDRRWMLIDENGQFLSQREVPGMACLHCTPTVTGIRVNDLRDGSSIDLPWKLQHGETQRAIVWDDAVDLILADERCSDWFSKRVGPTVRLAYMPDGCERGTDERYAKAITSLSDGFPYLIISQASLNELNARLPATDHIPMDRFRPNLVVAGGAAFQEDQWRRINIGQVAFEVVKPCGRCVITTTDQRTGARGKEPLATLASYRRRATDASKVDFGMNAIGDPSGLVRVGDIVRELSAVP